MVDEGSYELMRGFPLLRLVAISALASLLVTACQIDVNTIQSPTPEPATETGGDLPSAQVGVVLALSGANSAYGNPSRRGIELALAEMGTDSFPVDVRFDASYLDSEGDPSTAAEMFQQHVDNDVLAIFGPTLSNSAFEAHPVAQEAGAPVIAVSNTAAGITDTGAYIFRVSLAEADVVPQTVAALVEQEAPETAALIFSSDDAWSSSSAESFRTAAGEHGIDIITEQDVPSDGGDFSEEIGEIADADPDVILIAALEQPSIDAVMEIRDQGLEQRIACGNGCNTGTFIDATGDASEGLIVGSAWHIDLESEASQSFVERYRVMHGTDPDQFSAQGYAGVQVLAAAAENADSLSHDALRDSLAELGEVETVLGTFSFDEDRNGQHPAVIKVVRGGEFEVRE